MPIENIISLSSICKGSLIPVKNFHMNAISGGLGMVKNSILYPIFDDVMRNLIPSGIPQYLPIYHSKLLFGGYEESDEKLPKVLSLDDLAFGFILWLIACGISITAFTVELMIHGVIRTSKKILGLYVLLVILRRKMF